MSAVDATVVVTPETITVEVTPEVRTVVLLPNEIEVSTAPSTSTVEVTAPEVVVDVGKGFKGDKGDPGDPGVPGPSGQSYEHDQSVPSAVWTIPHGLGFFPGGILVLDTLGRSVVGQPSYPDANTLVLTFSAAFSGTAYLS
jgi:hypothetical protein